MTTDEMKNLPDDDRVKRAAYLRGLDNYKTGREHSDANVSDFYRLSLSGDERAAYMLGRFEASFDRKYPRLRVKRPVKPTLLDGDLEIKREREVA